MPKDIPVTKEFDKSTLVGSLRVAEEAIALLETGMFRLEPGLLKNPETGQWELVELSIVKDNSVNRKQL